MDLSTVKQDVLAGRARITEAVADVPAERHAVQLAGRAAPVPRVVVRPDTPSPVQHSKPRLGIQLHARPAQLNPAGGPHTVDLLVVVEMPALFKRRRDDHALRRLVREGDHALDGILPAEFVHVERQLARPVVIVVKRQRIAAARDLAGPGGARLREGRLPHRQQPHRAFRDLPAMIEIQVGNRVQAHIAVVGNRQRETDMPVGHEIIVPFLDPHPARPDVRPVIVPEQAARPARLGQIPLAVQ